MSRSTKIAFVAVPFAVLLLAGYKTYFGGEDTPPRQTLPAPRRPMLPDLTLARLSDVTPAVTDDGHRYILFTATIANVGRGPFVVHAVRHPNGTHWLVTQRFRERDGSTTERPTPANLVWGGHGHNHWHVRLGASYGLFRRGSSHLIRTLRKAGFCFFDQRPFRLTLPGAPPKGSFPKTTCNGRKTVALDMGLSPGWADPYSWLLPDQRLDITGLANGEYRLQATVDPDNWFRESDETNNVTWVDLRLRTTPDGSPRLDVLDYGPSAGVLPPA